MTNNIHTNGLTRHLHSRKGERFLTCVLTTLTILLFAIANESMGQDKANAGSELSRGNWSVGIHPYLGSGYETIPVMVTSATSDTRRGFAVTKVGLDNRTDQNVTAVKLTWRVATEQDPNTILLQGQTPFITREGGFPAGRHLVLRFPVVAFAKIYQPLVRNGALNGDFRIDILVSEILYEDGSRWTQSSSRQAKSVKAAHHPLRPIAQGTCAKQTCRTGNSPGGRAIYTCQASNFNEACTNAPDSFSCTNTSCGSTRPDGEDEGYEMIRL